MLVQFFLIISGKIKMFDVRLNPFKLKEYFIEYRKANSEWYIVPVPEFEYFCGLITSYKDVICKDLLPYIQKHKMGDLDKVNCNIIQLGFNEEMTFSFETEEEALYFKMKYVK